MSPYIHRRLFELSGVDAEYGCEDISPEALPDSVGLLKTFRGFNVTIPHKETVIGLLDGLDASAETYGAVNCVANKNGKLIGYGTDACGFIKALEYGGIEPSGRILVLGCGGAARTVARELAGRGCGVTIAARQASLGKAARLADWLTSFGSQADTADIAEISGDFALCVNATPVGMYPNVNEMPISEAALSKCGALFDAVYNPSETALLKAARRLGKKAVGGMPMLVFQAVKAHEYWYGGRFKDCDINALISDANTEMAGIFHEK